MKIEQRFEVSQPIHRVWGFFQDVPEVATCLPGAELLGQEGDNSFDGRVTVKLGPMTASFEGSCIVMSDPNVLTGRLEGKGVDKRGGSRGHVTVDYLLGAADSGGTLVSIAADVILSGAIAQFGRTGLINEMSKRLIGEFVQCLEAKLDAPSPEAAFEVRAGEVHAIRLFFASLWAWVKRWFTRS